jgi:hypothetical protein
MSLRRSVCYGNVRSWYGRAFRQQCRGHGQYFPFRFTLRSSFCGKRQPEHSRMYHSLASPGVVTTFFFAPLGKTGALQLMTFCSAPLLQKDCSVRRSKKCDFRASWHNESLLGHQNYHDHSIHISGKCQKCIGSAYVQRF